MGMSEVRDAMVLEDLNRYLVSTGTAGLDDAVAAEFEGWEGWEASDCSCYWPTQGIQLTLKAEGGYVQVEDFDMSAFLTFVYEGSR